MSKKNPLEIVVASLYKIPVIDGNKQVPEHKILMRANMKVTRGYVDSINDNSSDNFKMMVIDEKETVKLHERMQEKKERINEAVALKKASDANIIGKALSNVLKEEPKKT